MGINELPPGLYERVVDQELLEVIRAHPEFKAILHKIDDEASPYTYAQFVGQLVHQALRVSTPEKRVLLVNRLIGLLSSTDGAEFLERRRILGAGGDLLMEVAALSGTFPRPESSLAVSSLLTGHGSDPPLEHELRAEIMSSDRVDVLVSFIKWSGLRLLIPALEHLRDSGKPVRILSTSYMGASDPVALEWLASQPNVSVRLSYDTGGTRLHAKAYHFIRNSDYSTAYIGSANMSYSAMTNGLEWTVKVTAQDMAHILARFIAEFESYWESPEFENYNQESFERFRKSVSEFRKRSEDGNQFFAEITPRPFQLRVLEALQAKRLNGVRRNLVVAATGTGKTVISALDYRQFSEDTGTKPHLLFVAHRKEILEQSLSCFRTVLRDQNFGELLVDGEEPTHWIHVFASVQSLNNKQPWKNLGAHHFKFIVVDEVHHGAASIYRPIFTMLHPEILLGLTATPERMDGSSILPDFEGQFSAEIRLPEALEEKLLCPFQYFGVTDSIDLNEEKFWRNGRYDSAALESVFTGDDIRARQRLDVILNALHRYQPEMGGVRGVGFCVGVDHADYMARNFRQSGIASETILGSTQRDVRRERLKLFREGKITFIFTVDVLSEGVDLPEINMVLFLRPTESLTVFLQQLGRGLRHAPGKDCLTVLDFIGQTHRKYRLDTKYSALLSRSRRRLDREIEDDFPNLPPGCSIQLERIARDRILEKIRITLGDLKYFIPETIRTWEQERSRPLTLGDFLKETGISVNQVLSKHTWSEWKAKALNQPMPQDPDLEIGRKTLQRIALRSDPNILDLLCRDDENLSYCGEPTMTALHYLIWGKKGSAMGIDSLDESLTRWRRNTSLISDVREILEWRKSEAEVPIRKIRLGFPCGLQLHASYGLSEIKANLGLATLNKSGSTGVGVLHSVELKCYIHLITFQKEEKDFSPTTRYKDYPISRTLLHWESQSTVSQESATGQNYIHYKSRGYTILFFARLKKSVDGETMPYLFLGPVKSLVSYRDDRPIAMDWELEYPIPAFLFEGARAI